MNLKLIFALFLTSLLSFSAGSVTYSLFVDQDEITNTIKMGEWVTIIEDDDLGNPHATAILRDFNNSNQGYDLRLRGDQQPLKTNSIVWDTTGTHIVKFGYDGTNVYISVDDDPTTTDDDHLTTLVDDSIGNVSYDAVSIQFKELHGSVINIPTVKLNGVIIGENLSSNDTLFGYVLEGYFTSGSSFELEFELDLQDILDDPSDSRIELTFGNK